MTTNSATSPAYLLVLDIGSTFLKSTLFAVAEQSAERLHSFPENVDTIEDSGGNSRIKPLKTSRCLIPNIHPTEDEFEINPETLFQSILQLIQQNIEDNAATWSDVISVAITSQRNTFLTWDIITGRPYHNFISWKDKRAEKTADNWNRSIISGTVRLVGRGINSMVNWSRATIMSAIYFRSNHIFPRLNWTIQNVPGLKAAVGQKRAKVGLLDSWILYRLTNGQSFKIDYSSVSSTGMFNSATMRWSRPLLWLFGIPQTILPKVVPTVSDFGSISAEYFGGSKPITVMIADQQAAAFGHFLTSPGQAKLTLGTGAFITVNSDSKLLFDIENSIYTLVGWKLATKKPVFFTEAHVEDYSAVVSWCFANHIGLNDFDTPPSDLFDFPWFQGDDRIFVSRKGSLASSGQFIGDEKAFAVTEHLAHMIVARINFLSRIVPIKYPLNVDGGLSSSRGLLLMLAALLDQPIARPPATEMTSYGAAMLAGLGAGLWQMEDIEGMTKAVHCEIFSPKASLKRQLLERKGSYAQNV